MGCTAQGSLFGRDTTATAEECWNYFHVCVGLSENWAYLIFLIHWLVITSLFCDSHLLLVCPLFRHTYVLLGCVPFLYSVWIKNADETWSSLKTRTYHLKPYKWVIPIPCCYQHLPTINRSKRSKRSKDSKLHPAWGRQCRNGSKELPVRIQASRRETVPVAQWFYLGDNSLPQS